MANEKDLSKESNLKEKTNKAKKEKDNFDNDFEKVETIFPPIFYPETKDGELVFIPQVLREGPNGPLITCKLLKNTAGTFKRSDEEVELEDDIFALGETPTITGDDKLILKHKRGDKAELSVLGEALVEMDLPVKLIYKGKQKSKASKFSYHVYEFFAHKKALLKAQDSF
jgi:hypothetical protein